MAAAYVPERKVSAAEAADSNMKQKVYESDKAHREMPCLAFYTAPAMASAPSHLDTRRRPQRHNEDDPDVPVSGTCHSLSRPNAITICKGPLTSGFPEIKGGEELERNTFVSTMAKFRVMKQ
jgi:hypothetical protein